MPDQRDVTALPLSLAEIVATDATDGWKAEACLRSVAAHNADDLAETRLLAAAQTYALLEIAGNIGQSDSGLNLTQSIRAAGGIQ